MRVISKFKDFYDSALQHGADQSRVFVRERQEFLTQQRYGSQAPKLPAVYEPFVSLMGQDAPHTWSKTNPRTSRTVQVLAVVILFGGTLYPCARVRVYEKKFPSYRSEPIEEDLADSERFIYGAPELHRILTAELGDGMDDKKTVPFWHRRGRHQEAAGTVEQLWDAFFAQGNRRRADGLAQELHVAAAVYCPVRALFELNPKLADYQLYRVLSPEQALQELEMFLGNLAMPERHTVEIEDKYRIPQHGFDARSFRKDPEPTRAEKRAKSKAPGAS